MNDAGKLVLAIPFVLAASSSLAADVQRSIEVPASVPNVWARIGEFCAIQAWHPDVTRCALEETDATVYRSFQTADGASFREQLLEQNPSAFFYSYVIDQSPLPVVNYSARFSVGPGADQTSVVVWQAEFTALGVDEDEAEGQIIEMYESGLQGIADLIAAE